MIANFSRINHGLSSCFDELSFRWFSQFKGDLLINCFLKRINVSCEMSQFTKILHTISHTSQEQQNIEGKFFSSCVNYFSAMLNLETLTAFVSQFSHNFIYKFDLLTVKNLPPNYKLPHEFDIPFFDYIPTHRRIRNDCKTATLSESDSIHFYPHFSLKDHIYKSLQWLRIVSFNLMPQMAYVEVEGKKHRWWLCAKSFCFTTNLSNQIFHYIMQTLVESEFE